MSLHFISCYSAFQTNNQKKERKRRKSPFTLRTEHYSLDAIRINGLPVLIPKYFVSLLLS